MRRFSKKDFDLDADYADCRCTLIELIDGGMTWKDAAASCNVTQSFIVSAFRWARKGFKSNVKPRKLSDESLVRVRLKIQQLTRSRKTKQNTN